MESSRDMIPEYVYSRQAEFENSEVYSRTIERRYQGEDQMLSYISQGNLKECLHIFQSNDGDGAPLNMDDVYHRYPDDFLRSVKNSMISLNTLCRIAARRGGVSAFIVGSISYKYGLLIEGSSSAEFLQKKVTPMMFSDYCLAVRDCSTAQYSAKVQEITTYILEHLPSELTVNQLAELFFLNVSSLSRKFKSETGFSVTEFINFHRIKLSQYYLSQGNRSITEVAYLVGYNDSNYFCRMFKKVTSITPSQYLKNVRTEGMLI